MAKLNLILRHISPALFFVSIVHTTAFAYKPSEATIKSKKDAAVKTSSVATGQSGPSKANNKATAVDDQGGAVERNFDKIRSFYSYDPATDKWSEIEDFETVEILEDATQQREDRYIYHSFWAYDALEGRWYKVDIRDHGYRLSKAETPEKAPKKPFRFWKNLVLGLRVGGGATFYNNTVSHLSLIERDGQFFLQTAEGKKEQIAYEIRWPGEVYEGKEKFNTTSGSPDINEVGSDKKIVFRGMGWSFPVSLLGHYTFFSRLRLGGGVGLELNYLQELKPKEDAARLNDFKVQQDYKWFYNVAWFGLVGFKVLHRPLHDIILDVQLGKNHNIGTDPRTLWSKQEYVYQGWLVGAGLSYERKLNNYFRFVTRLSGDLKMHDATPYDIEATQARVQLNQLAVHLELGLNLNFGKDVEEGESAAEHDSDASSPQASFKKLGR